MKAERKETESDLAVDVFFTNSIRGKDGDTPYIRNGNWWIGDKDTGVLARGVNGNTPQIGADGAWWLGGVSTGKPSMGQIPSGVILMWAGAVNRVPEGWKLCVENAGFTNNGIAIPNLSGRFVIGYGPNGGICSVSGNTGGSGEVKLESANMPPHIHLNGMLDEDEGSFHQGATTNNITGRGLGMEGNSTDLREGYTSKVGGKEGEAVPFSILPPYYVLAYIIKL